MGECLPFFFTGKVSKLTSGRLGMAYKHGLALGLFELSGKECRRNWDDTKMMVALSRSGFGQKASTWCLGKNSMGLGVPVDLWYWTGPELYDMLNQVKINVKDLLNTNTNTNTHVYVYMCIYMCEYQNKTHSDVYIIQKRIMR